MKQTTALPAAAGTMNAGEWTMLIALSVLWGGSFYFNGVAVAGLPPLTIVFLRVSLAALVLWALCAARGIPFPRRPAVWAAFFGMGLLNNVVPFSLIVWGQKEIASGLAAILNATTPIFGALIAHVATEDEKLTPNRALGVALGLGGVVAMIGPSFLSRFDLSNLAQLAVLGAAMSYGLAGVFGRRFRRLGVSPVETAAGQVTASAAILAPVMLLAERPWNLATPEAQVWFAVIGLALLSTALAYVLFFRILATAGATNVYLVTLLVPVSAVLLGWLFLGERLDPRHFAGMALIAAGLAAIDGRLLRRFRPAAN